MDRNDEPTPSVSLQTALGMNLILMPELPSGTFFIVGPHCQYCGEVIRPFRGCRKNPNGRTHVMAAAALYASTTDADQASAISNQGETNGKEE